MSPDGDYRTIDALSARAGDEPCPLNEAALHGIAGQFTRYVAPHTEADPVAILVQFLVAFGSVVGRTAFFKVEATSHYTNLFTVLVGRSSKSRKGTSWDHVRSIFAAADNKWESTRVQAGLSTGEGVIQAVRDAEEKTEPVKEKGIIRSYQRIVVDAGEADKRLLVVEPEFARTLKVMARESSILSAILRQAWDSGNLRVMTKAAYKATGAHISVIGHITCEELRRYLTDTETANGFANRYMWIHVQRSKLLPHGGSLDDLDMTELTAKLREAVTFANSTGQMHRDREATTAWDKVYGDLSREETGMMGSVTSRAEAQVLRLSMVYALLDRSAVIRIPHLKAALTMWEYAEQSTRYIFGDAIGDPVADRILCALLARPDGMNRTEINSLFWRNCKAERITAALHALRDHGAAISEMIVTGGRPAEIWKAR